MIEENSGKIQGSQGEAYTAADTKAVKKGGIGARIDRLDAKIDKMLGSLSDRPRIFLKEMKAFSEISLMLASLPLDAIPANRSLREIGSSIKSAICLPFIYPVSLALAPLNLVFGLVYSSCCAAFKIGHEANRIKSDQRVQQADIDGHIEFE